MVTPAPAALPPHPLRSLIRRFDAFQRRRQGVYEYCDAPGCILRIQVTRAHHALEIGDISVAANQPVIEIHFWNEHLPVAPAGGPDAGWGLGIQRAFIGSLRALARLMKSDPALADVQAVGGVFALISPSARPAGARLMERMGFTVRPYYRPLGRFGEFWEKRN
jgi:hypothetical protein